MVARHVTKITLVVAVVVDDLFSVLLLVRAELILLDTYRPTAYESYMLESPWWAWMLRFHPLASAMG